MDSCEFAFSSISLHYRVEEKEEKEEKEERMEEHRVQEFLHTLVQKMI